MSDVQDGTTWPDGTCKGSGEYPSMTAQDGKGMCRVCSRWRSLNAPLYGGRRVRKHKGATA